MANFDIIGNIAIIKTDGMKKQEIVKQAKELLKRPNIKTVVEKATRFKGRLRTIKTKHLAGEKDTIAICKENNCIFKLDIEKCYFSSRLSNERLEVANMIKKKDRVLVMFAGVAPFSIVIAKNSQAKKIFSNEINKKANEYAEQPQRWPQC